MRERENTATRKTPVSTNRDTVSLLGKFMPGSGGEARVLDYPKAARSFKLPNQCSRLSRGLGDEIIVGMSDDFDGSEFAHGQVAARVNSAVNVGSIGLPASDDHALSLEFGARCSGVANQAVFPGDAVGVLELRRAGFVLDQHLYRAANEGCADAPGDLELCRHGSFAALLFDPVGDLVRHVGGPRALLFRVGEHAEALEAGLADEVEQGLEIGLGLARKTDNKRRSQRDPGQAGANPADQIDQVS